MLHNTYAFDTTMLVMQLFYQLQTLKKGNQYIIDALKIEGENILVLELVVCALGGLDANYKPFV